jgi:cytochrome c-type biogenesis protein CcmE
MKVVGMVAEGSIDTYTTNGRVETHFQIHDGKGHVLPILYPHNPPDPFKEGRQVIVEGVLEKGDDGKERVLCQKLTVKCPSKYQEEGLADANSDNYYRQKYGSGGAGIAPP